VIGNEPLPPDAATVTSNRSARTLPSLSTPAATNE
jgi:hypothetical protein